MTDPTTITHGHFLLLINVSGVPDEIMEQTARDVSATYMGQFRHLGAFTASVYRLGVRRQEGSTLDTPLRYAVRYFGPDESVGGLQAALTAAATSVGATIQTLTFEAEDVTGLF